MDKECILYDRKCTGCGECDMCDIDSGKRCNNCGKCIEGSKGEFLSLDVKKFLKNSENNVQVKRTGKGH